MFPHNLPLISCLENISESKWYRLFFVRPLVFLSFWIERAAANRYRHSSMLFLVGRGD
jgi:hypothetical protein